MGNRDIIVAGYDSVHNAVVESNSDGLILFWSFRNTSFYEKIIKTSSGVTAIDFSLSKPTVMAAGMKDGRIAIFDTSKSQNMPLLDSAFVQGRHMTPVWQVKWINKGGERD